MITLTLKEPTDRPARGRDPLARTSWRTLSHDAIRALPVYLGKRQRRLDDFFDVEGEASDEIEIRGDAGKVKWIGRGMTPRAHHASSATPGCTSAPT